MSVFKLNQENFKSIIETDKPVLVDFYADWCGPCRMMSPIVDEIAEENSDFVVGKVNVDESPELAQQFSVVSIPTLVIIKNGQVENQVVGVRPKEQLIDMLKG